MHRLFIFLAGVIYRCLNRQFLYGLYMLVLTACYIAVPHLPNLILLGVVHAIMGFLNGASGTAAQAWLLEIWAHKSSPFLHSYHLCFSIGNIIGPLICTPFLSPEKNPTTTTVNPNIFFTNISSDFYLSGSENPNGNQTDSKIAIPYAISSLFFLLTGFVNFGIVFYFFFYRKTNVYAIEEVEPQPSTSAAENISIIPPNSQETSENLTNFQKSVTPLLLTLQIGLEVEVGQYLPVFVYDLGKYKCISFNLSLIILFTKYSKRSHHCNWFLHQIWPGHSYYHKQSIGYLFGYSRVCRTDAGYQL